MMKTFPITPLCELGFKYGTDKCPQLKHTYTPFYYDLLKEQRNVFKKVLEVGVGHYRGMQKNEWHFDPGLNRQYHRGASLYMWRDFFPNAQIYGADRVPETVFKDDRIQTYLFDERKIEDMEMLINKIGSDIDFVVDDASHHVDDQVFLAKNLLPLLNKNVLYVIEDVNHSRVLRKELSEYETYVIDPPRTWHGGMLFVIKHKNHGS